jgi:hypothetical protein
LAIRVRKVGSGAVDAAHPNRPTSVGTADPTPDLPASINPVSKYKLGDRGHQRRRGGIRILPAQQINGAAAADEISQIRGGAAATRDTAAPNVVLEKQAHRLLHCGDRVAGRPIITMQRTLQQPVPIGGGMRMLAENLRRIRRDRGVCDPTQHMVQGPARQSCGVEERVDHLRRLSGIETGGVVPMPTGDRTLNRAGGERLGPPLRHHRINTARHRIPYQLRQPSGQPERIQHHTGTIITRPHRETQQQIIHLGQGHQRRTRRLKKRRSKQIKSLAAPLRADDTGGAVPRHPQLPAAGFVGSAEPPTQHLSRLEDHLHWS